MASRRIRRSRWLIGWRRGASWRPVETRTVGGGCAVQAQDQAPRSSSGGCGDADSFDEERAFRYSRMNLSPNRPSGDGGCSWCPSCLD